MNLKPKTINKIKKKLSTIIIILTSTFLFAQSKKTNFLSEEFFKAGINSIIETKNDNGLLFNFNTFNTFNFGSEKVNFNRYQIEYRENTYFLIDKNSMDTKYKYSLSVRNDSMYLSTPYENGMIEKLTSKIYDDQNIFVLILFIREVNLEENYKINYEKFNRSTNSCSASNTYYSVGWGLSSDASQSHLTNVIQSAAADGAFNGCTEISNDYTTSCAKGNHICVSTFAWCCK